MRCPSSGRPPPRGSVCGIDLDPRSLVRAEQRLAFFGVRFVPVLGSYAEMVSLVQGIWGAEARADGVLLDLGISSRQVDAPDSVSVSSGMNRWTCASIRRRTSRRRPTSSTPGRKQTWRPLSGSTARNPGPGPLPQPLYGEGPVHTTAQLARVVAGSVGAEERTRPPRRRQKAHQDPSRHAHLPGPAHHGERRTEHPGRRAGGSGGTAGSRRPG